MRWVDASEGRWPVRSAFYVVQTQRSYSGGGSPRAVTVVRWKAGIPRELQSSTAWRHALRWFDMPVPDPPAR